MLVARLPLACTCTETPGGGLENSKKTPGLKRSATKLDLQFSKLLIAGWCVYLILNMPLKYFDYLSEGISISSLVRLKWLPLPGLCFHCLRRASSYGSRRSFSSSGPNAKRLKRLVAGCFLYFFFFFFWKQTVNKWLQTVQQIAKNKLSFYYYLNAERKPRPAARRHLKRNVRAIIQSQKSQEKVGKAWKKSS